jgi:radical SAM protein
MVSFAERPVLVFWETTRACPLACAHCRASAILNRSDVELSTDEGRTLLRSVTRFGRPFPTVVLTGGDPLMRPDLFELLGEARKLGLHVAVSPAVSERLTPETLARMRELGVAAVSVSLDGAEPATHDAFRGAPGTFARTMESARAGLNVGLRVQVNTTVTRSNVRELPSLLHQIHEAGVRAWEVFFLIGTGRGRDVEAVTAKEAEAVGHFLYDASRYGVLVRPVEAPFLRRILKERSSGGEGPNTELYRYLRGELERHLGPPTRPSSLAPQGTLDGDGILFVGHDGSVYPGGFLPWRLGDARHDDLVDLYRATPLLNRIRAREFRGPCGRCPYREACGGSRARAFAETTDPLGSDPACWFAREPVVA